MRIISILFVIMLGSVSVLAQGLDEAWQAYSSTSAEISRLNTERQALFEEQLSLKAEMNGLQSQSNWYSIWLNKLLLSVNTQRQMQIVTSLADIDARLTLLGKDHDRELDQLKTAYARMVDNYEATGRFPEELKMTAQRVGRLILDESTIMLSLPDYSGLVNGEYRSPALRHLVLEDVKRVLATKLMQMDSLLEDWRAEEELARRLEAFHVDLGLQIEAGRDIQERDESGEPAKSFSWDAASESFYSGADGGNDLSTQDRLASSSEAPVMRVGREVLDPGSEHPDRSDKVGYLLAKRGEYESLLQEIEDTLSDSQ